MATDEGIESTHAAVRALGMDGAAEGQDTDSEEKRDFEPLGTSTSPGW